MTKEPFVLCGDLLVCYQIGGDTFAIDRRDLAKLVCDHFGVPVAGTAEGDRRPVGRVRITIERLAATSDIEMDEKKLRDYIDRFLPIAEKAVANATGYQEFKLLEIPLERFRYALALLERGDVDAAWALLETSK